MNTTHKSQPFSSKQKGKQKSAWDLRLYVAGQTPRSLTVFENLKRICEERLAGQCLLEQPQLARVDQFLALPTLVHKLPVPRRKIIGDLSNTGHVPVGLDLRPRT